MNAQAPEQSIVLTIVNALGLHARSAAKVAAICSKAQRRVWVRKDGETVDASSIIDLLSLGCPQGTQIEVVIEHEQDRPVLEEIAALVRSGFGESP